MPKVATRKRQKHVKRHIQPAPLRSQEVSSASEQDDSQNQHQDLSSSCGSKADGKEDSLNAHSSLMSPSDSDSTSLPSTPVPTHLYDHNYACVKNERSESPLVQESIPSQEKHEVCMDILLSVRGKLLAMLPNFWVPVVTNKSQVTVIALSRQEQIVSQRCINFHVSGDVCLSVHCKSVPVDEFLDPAFPCVPLSDETVNSFVDRVVNVVSKVRLKEVCAGVDIDKYSAVWERCSAGVVDENPYKECRYSETFRSHNCAVLIDSQKWRCTKCSSVIKTLRKQYISSMQRGNRSNKTPNIFLNEEEKLKKLKNQRQKIDSTNQQLRRMRERMQSLLQKEGKKIEENVAQDLSDILRDANLTPAQSIFLQQQVKASQLRNKCSMRWHPAIIRLAISIHSKSRSAYEQMRDSGFVDLPSSRTLYDYTHFASVKEGIDCAAMKAVCSKIKDLPKKQKYHVLMADEMYISKNLVYKKGSGELIGYTNLNDVDKDLKALEKYLEDPNIQVKDEIASKVLAYLIKGVANGVKEVVASYAVNSVSPRQMYSWTWKLIGALERSKIHIVAFVCDGCPTNRAFIKMHEPAHPPRPSGVVYSTVNKAAPKRKLYFISDVPHLLKTIRNSFCRSRLGKKGKRCMTKNSQKIVWDHIIRLYNEKKSRVLRKSYKLTAQHVYPDSYSCMRVGIAAQVLSRTVAQDLERQNWPGTSETVNFLRKCNDWFDNHNGAHTSVGVRLRNKRLLPYKTADDWRFQESEDFVHYLLEWRSEAYSAPPDASGLVSESLVGEDLFQSCVIELVEDNDDDEEQTPADKRLPAAQTILGIEMSTLAIKEAIQFLLSEGLDFVNARVFCQDPLEQYFSKQRAGCGGSSNPNVAQFLSKQRSIQVVGEIGIKTKRKRGNTEILPCEANVSDEPLQKRPRKSEGFLSNAPQM